VSRRPDIGEKELVMSTQEPSAPTPRPTSAPAVEHPAAVEQAAQRGSFQPPNAVAIQVAPGPPPPPATGPDAGTVAGADGGGSTAPADQATVSKET
jgi:hypothetical protein